ncbi:MAG: hypothetical protein HOV76_29830 [Hamadaea sp.]|nr:hypothetical protein [Hamadaea sp.]
MKKQLHSCVVCKVRPPAMREIPYCFACWPGGPVTPPPCRKCGSTRDYWSSGLCARCHPSAPGSKSPVWRNGGLFAENKVVIDSCIDCLCWGTTRTFRWLCQGCRAWRERYRTIGVCPTCAMPDVHLHDKSGSCRLCHKQRGWLSRETGQRISTFTLAEANRRGQQLFLIGMFHFEGSGPVPYRKVTVPPDMSLLRPVAWEQLTLFDAPRDLRLGLAHGFPELPDTALMAAFNAHVNDHARRFGWAHAKSERVKRGIRVMLAIQDTPGAAIRRSDVALLSRIKHSAQVVADVLADAGMLAEDRQPAVVRWFEATVAELPAPMRHELSVWFDVMRNGSTTPPRQQPRQDTTITSKLRWAMPALRQWASEGVMSLREIGRDNVKAVLPREPGRARSCLLQGLRCVFRILKGRKLVFVNPTLKIKVEEPGPTIPAPVDLAQLRALLNSADPATAALSALLAFHAIRLCQLRHLKLTDYHDGRLHLPNHVVVLAEPVRQRLTAYLDYRQRMWPTSTNPYLFVHVRSWSHHRPVWPNWICRQLGMSGQQIRRDRILDEAHATSGDIKALIELFGLTAEGAIPYAVARRDPPTEPRPSTSPA